MVQPYLRKSNSFIVLNFISVNLTLLSYISNCKISPNFLKMAYTLVFLLFKIQIEIQTSLQIGHFASGLATLSPSKMSTEAAEHAHDLQKRCPQLKAYGLNTVSYKKIQAQVKASNKKRFFSCFYMHPKVKLYQANSTSQIIIQLSRIRK